MKNLNNFMDGKYNGRFVDKAHWELKFTWLPKKCDITGRRIWLEMAYKGTAIWTGPGEPIVEVRWHEKLEHLIWAINPTA